MMAAEDVIAAKPQIADVGAYYVRVLGVRSNRFVEFEFAIDDPEQFPRTLTEKLLTYALGRGLEHYDAPAVRRITRAAANADHRFSALVLGIVESTPFQWRRARTDQQAPVAAEAGP